MNIEGVPKELTPKIPTHNLSRAGNDFRHTSGSSHQRLRAGSHDARERFLGAMCIMPTIETLQIQGQSRIIICGIGFKGKP